MAERPCDLCKRPLWDGGHALNERECSEPGGHVCRLVSRLAIADRVAAAARSVKVAIETGHQQALAAELLGALMDYDSAALFRVSN